MYAHWINHIKEYGSPIGYDSSAEEAMHKEVKSQYGRTNKQEDYQSQILWHAERKMNLLAMSDVLMHDATNAGPMASKDILVRTTRASKPWRLKSPRWGISKDKADILKKARVDPKTWRPVKDVAQLLDMPDLINALGPFIRRRRFECDREANGQAAQHLQEESRWEVREEDSSWVSECLIHPSITCWKRTGKSTDTETLTREVVRCSHA